MNKSALGTILGVTLLSLCRKGGSSSFYARDDYEQEYLVFPIQIKFKKPYYKDHSDTMVYGDLLRYIPVAIEMIQELWSRLVKLRPKCTKLHVDFNEAWADRILQNQIIDVINKGLREIQVTNEFGTVKLYDSFVVDNRTSARFVYFFTKILSQEDALCRILPFPEWESEITDSSDGVISKETIISDFGSNKKLKIPNSLLKNTVRGIGPDVMKIWDWEAENICSTSWLDFKFKLDIPTNLFFLRQTEEQWKWYFLMILRTAMEFVLLEARYYHQNEKIIMPSIYVEQAPIGFIEPDIHSVFSTDNPMKLRDR
jgi:hypothetical protein